MVEEVLAQLAASPWALVLMALLVRRTAPALFTARFVPFARLAVNLTAGASRVPAARYLAVAAPGSAWTWCALARRGGRSPRSHARAT